MKQKIFLSQPHMDSSAFDYTQDYTVAMRSLGGNSGNTIFQFSLQCLLDNPKNEIETLHCKSKIWDIESQIERINNECKAVLIAPANIFASYTFRGGDLTKASKIIRKLKVPVHLISAGAQSSYEYSFGFLREIAPASKELVSAVLDSGGNIGVRGYFTQEVIQKLGFKADDCTVIGCPSLFIKGNTLKINKPVLSEQELIPMINGTPVWNHRQVMQYFSKYPKAVFVDQDKFYRLLYKPEALGRKELKYLSSSKTNWLEMYLEDRIKLYGDYQSWVADIQKRGINFSFGNRIHGNILPILQGIPAYITATDSRVRELSEYFAIPHEKLPEKLTGLYDYYQKADYTEFNKNFAARYETFKAFMHKCGVEIEPKESLSKSDIKIPQISAQHKSLIKQQAKICNSFKGAYVVYAFYKFLARLLKREFRF